MDDNKFIAYIYNSSDKSVSYLFNTSPILWTDSSLKAKLFDSPEEIISELKENEQQLVSSLKSKTIDSIWIIPIPSRNQSNIITYRIKEETT